MNLVSLFVCILTAVALVEGILRLQKRQLKKFNWRLFFADTTGGVPFDLVSGDAQRALENFREDLMIALTQAPNNMWATDLGLSIPSRAIRTTFPVPVTSAGYVAFKNDIKYRKLLEQSISVKQKTWQDGVAELASIVEAPDFIGWLGEPERMALAAQCLPNEIIGGLLEANGTGWDGQTFFDGSNNHPINLFDGSFGTFNNSFSGGSTAPSTTALETAKQNMRKIKGPNGKPLGLRVTHIVCAPDKEETWRNIIDRDLIIESFGANQFGAVDNRHKSSVTLVVADQLTVAAQWYAVAANKPGIWPWVVLDGGDPEIIMQDKTDALYKSSLKIGLAGIKLVQGALLLPQCIHRYVGS
jgi:phage major head subunit gpT-like protein